MAPLEWFRFSCAVNEVNAGVLEHHPPGHAPDSCGEPFARTVRVRRSHPERMLHGNGMKTEMTMPTIKPADAKDIAAYLFSLE